MSNLQYHPAPCVVDDEGEAFARAVFCRFLRQATISRDIDDVIEVRLTIRRTTAVAYIPSQELHVSRVFMEVHTNTHTHRLIFVCGWWLAGVDVDKPHANAAASPCRESREFYF